MLLENMGHEFVLLVTMRVQISAVAIGPAALSIRQFTSQCAELDGRTPRNKGCIRCGRHITDILFAIHIYVVVVVPCPPRPLRRRGPIRGIC